MISLVSLNRVYLFVGAASLDGGSVRHATRDLSPSSDGEKVKKLGLPQTLAPYWLAADPSPAWHAGDKQARAVYTKCVHLVCK